MEFLVDKAALKSDTLAVKIQEREERIDKDKGRPLNTSL